MKREICMTVSLLGGILAGCSPEPKPAPAVAEPAEPAAPQEPDATRKAPLVFVVRSEDGGGLVAEIRLEKSQTEFEHYADVPSSGEVAHATPCNAGQRFQARPAIEDFQLGEPQACKPRVVFTMLSVKRTFEFQKRGEDALQQGDLLLAQKDLGTAADRLQFDRPEEARTLRLKSTAIAGRLLGVEHPIDASGTAPEASADFHQRVSEFQKLNHLPATGELNAETRIAISRMKIQGAQVVVPPTAQAGAAESAVATSPQVSAAESAVPAPVNTLPAKASMSLQETLKQPASPENAQIIHVNKAQFGKASVIQHEK